MKYPAALTLVAGVLALAAPTAHAQKAGEHLIRFGGMKITPHVKSGDLSSPAPSGSTIDNSPASNVSGGVVTMITDNIALDLPLAPPFVFKIYGTGSASTNGQQIGTVKSLPATNFLQYRFFNRNTEFRPYVGLGITYAYFFDSDSSDSLTSITNPGSSEKTTFKVKSKFVPSVQLGATYMIEKPYFIDIWYGKTFLTTTTTLSTGQTQKVTLDPSILQLGVGLKF